MVFHNSTSINPDAGPSAISLSRATDDFASSSHDDSPRRAPHVGRVGDYVTALQSIATSSCERDMLRTHARMGDQGMSGEQLATTVGHFGARIGHKKYGRLARKIADAAGLPTCKADVSDYLAAIFTLADGKQDASGEDWRWVMHPELVEAMIRSGMIKAH
jgi:hypothetical protein